MLAVFCDSFFFFLVGCCCLSAEKKRQREKKLFVVLLPYFNAGAQVGVLFFFFLSEGLTETAEDSFGVFLRDKQTSDGRKESKSEVIGSFFFFLNLPLQGSVNKLYILIWFELYTFVAVVSSLLVYSLWSLSWGFLCFFSGDRFRVEGQN